LDNGLGFRQTQFIDSGDAVHLPGGLEGLTGDLLEESLVWSTREDFFKKKDSE